MAKGGSSPEIRFILLLVLLGAGVWGMRAVGLPSFGSFRWFSGNRDDAQPAEKPAADAPASPTRDPDAGAPVTIRLNPATPVAPVEAPAVEFSPIAPPTPPAVGTDAQIAEAARAYREGLVRQTAGELVEARGLLSAALASGLLTDTDAWNCRMRLTEIADSLVFSREIHPGDPYTREYRIQSGDVLARIVKRENLHVPHEGVQVINGISDPRRIRVGQRIKLIQGPFDAIITKHSYTLDLYHHGMFVRSFHIGLGQNGSTPTGRWIVRDRVPQATWTPPPSDGGSRIIEPGQPGYPLGTKGYWIALKGQETSNEMVSGFGIHGTDEPDSIGKQASLGCIRLRDPDIEMVFNLLCAGKSKVEVRP